MFMAMLVVMTVLMVMVSFTVGMLVLLQVLYGQVGAGKS